MVEGSNVQGIYKKWRKNDWWDATHVATHNPIHVAIHDPPCEPGMIHFNGKTQLDLILMD